VLGTVETFLDTSAASENHTRRCRLAEERDDDLLVAVLDEVIYVLDTEGQAPVDINVCDSKRGVEVTFAMVDATTLPQIGAVPKAVSLNEIRLAREQAGWRCSVTLDV
jgi:SHS2 domain-containing protein